MIESIMSSDLTLVIFSLLLGGLIGVFGERMRHPRQNPFRRED